MGLIKFSDSCTISRVTGRDEWDEELTDVVYSGACLGPSLNSIVVRNDTLYLPENNVLVEVNDIVDAVITKGRKTHGIVKKVRDIKFGMFGRECTRIELKQATESEPE